MKQDGHYAHHKHSGIVLQSFEARHVANILWAVASLRDRQPHLTGHLDARVLEVRHLRQ